jgi:hypothetical protein
MCVKRAFAAFSDKTVDPRGDDGQRDRVKLQHRTVEGANFTDTDRLKASETQSAGTIRA